MNVEFFEFCINLHDRVVPTCQHFPVNRVCCAVDGLARRRDDLYERGNQH